MRSAIKISGWTLGMALAAFLIFDGKSSNYGNALYHVLYGGIIGLVLGWLFSRKKPVDSN
jgi:hypothetical protein